MGVALWAGGAATFRVWAPHARHVILEAAPGTRDTAPPDGAPNLLQTSLRRCAGDTWAVLLPPGVLGPGVPYRLLLSPPYSDEPLLRRDPYARSADFASAWCFVSDVSEHGWGPALPWRTRVAPEAEGQLARHDEALIYEMHIGSFTPEGTLVAAAEKLQHVADQGFTVLELMPCTEHSDPWGWGYSPRQLLALHRAYGSPKDMAAFVDRAHELGLGVIMDVVLHHGAPDRNELWEFDGWTEDGNGGIYHERAADTMWGRQLAFWKREVSDMIVSACHMWLGEYRMDGLRFDSVHDLALDVAQRCTWEMHENYPGCLLTAEVTPEDPASLALYGFDSIWVHSGYFDIIQQHRALGRGSHGGGDYASGWDLERLRTAMGLHYGFERPQQCIKYMLGSHDQVGCHENGRWYPDYAPIGGHHRYAVDQYCGGRGDSHAGAAVRLWYAANIVAAGIPLVFMGNEWMQAGWWNNDEWHRLQWDQATDEVGRGMMAAVRDINKLRADTPTLRRGWAKNIHEDRGSGVMGYERVLEGEPRIIIVVNAARRSWQQGEYGLWVGPGAGAFEEIYCSQSPEYGGWDGWVSNKAAPVAEYGERIHINLPAQCTLVFKSVF